MHPESGVIIYNDGTCSVGHHYSQSGYKIYYGKKGSGVGSYSLHRHVAELFVPNPENKPIVNHKDGKKYNTRASNLEWTTHAENCQHAHNSGLNKRKLTASDVSKIRKSKLSAERICFQFDVSAVHIRRIRNNESWKLSTNQ